MYLSPKYINEKEPFNYAKYPTASGSPISVSPMAEQTQHDEGEDQVYHQARNRIPNGTRKRFEKRIKTRLPIGALF